MKYRKKPIVIEAVPWARAGDHASVISPVPPEVELPAGIGAGEPADLYRLSHGAIPTLEGWMIVSPGDYIIRGIQGEHYPCKPDIFAATYEPVG